MGGFWRPIHRTGPLESIAEKESAITVWILMGMRGALVDQGCINAVQVTKNASALSATHRLRSSDEPSLRLLSLRPLHD